MSFKRLKNIDKELSIITEKQNRSNISIISNPEKRLSQIDKDRKAYQKKKSTIYILNGTPFPQKNIIKENPTKAKGKIRRTYSPPPPFFFFRTVRILKGKNQLISDFSTTRFNASRQWTLQNSKRITKILWKKPNVFIQVHRKLRYFQTCKKNKISLDFPSKLNKKDYWLNIPH